MLMTRAMVESAAKPLKLCISSKASSGIWDENLHIEEISLGNHITCTLGHSLSMFFLLYFPIIYCN